MKSISDEVADVLRAGHGDETTFFLAADKRLDRKLYVAVDKALCNLGGKWNRKSGGHVFEGDPMALIAEALANGGYTDRKQELQEFETPPELARRMIKLAEIQPDDFILEPSAGPGALVNELLMFTGAKVVAVEIDNRNIERLTEIALPPPGEMSRLAVVPADFLEWAASTNDIFDAVVMNPPFSRGQDIKHVRAAHRLLRISRRLVAIMSEGPFFRQDRQAVEFRDWLGGHNHTAEPLPDGTFKQSGTGASARLVVITSNLED